MVGVFVQKLTGTCTNTGSLGCRLIDPIGNNFVIRSFRSALLNVFGFGFLTYVRLGAGLFLATTGFGSQGIQGFFTITRLGFGEGLTSKLAPPELPFFEAVITI